MMHRIFYRCFPTLRTATDVTRVAFGTAIGMCLGSTLFFCMPQQELAGLVAQLSVSPKMGQSLLMSVLPVVLASGFMFFGAVNLAQIAVPAFSGLLMTFSAMTIGYGGSSLTVYLMLLGRSMSLAVLFWFLLSTESESRRSLVTDSVLAVALTALVMLFANWLTAPGIRVLLNS